MKMEFIIILAMVLSVLSFIVGLVQIVKESRQRNKRLEIAKANGWVTDARLVDEKVINKANGRDYEKARKEMILVRVYEYKINGKKQKLKIKSSTRTVELRHVYYDPENNYQILNIDNNANIKIVLIIPIILFVITILVLKSIFYV